MQSALTEVGEVTLLSLTGQRIWSLAGAEANEQFGAALAPLSFGNGPVFEFLVGAPGWRNRTGRVYLVTAEGEAPLIISGEINNGELGRWVAAGPDYDGDGFPSLLAVEPGVIGPEAKPGRTTAYQTFSRPRFGAARFMRNDEIELTVHGRAGVSYRIDGSDDLLTWEALKGFISRNIIEKVTIEIVPKQNYKFYRLSAVPVQ
jgi:hypothetical protein